MYVAVHQYLTETTVHGLVHFTGERRFYIKLIWFLAVLASFSYCTLRVSEVYKKYISKDVATTVQANALEFEFPDVYICNESPISGSRSVTLNEEDSAFVSQYRRLINSTIATMTFEGTAKALDSYAIRLINSLPFQFVSDKMGQQLSSILYFYLEGNTDWKGAIHNHPFYINCYNLNLTNQDRINLRNPSNLVQIILFLDPPLPSPFDNTTEQDIRDYESGTINLKPVDWDFNYGTDFTISTGFRVFLAPRGQYPSDFEKQIVVGPAQQHRIVIKMQDIVYSNVDFADKCESNSEASADFLNPYSGGKQTFKYSHAVCWYREVARLSLELFNCSAWRLPIPWEYRWVPSCFNVSLFHSDMAFTDEMNTKRARILDLGRRACESKILCRSRTYAYEYSSSSWPSDRVWEQFMQRFITRSKIEESEEQLLGIQYMMYNITTDKAKRSVVQITLSAAERMSSETQLALAYSFNSLIADVGGLLGLFLGMSLLSVLELVELLYGCLVAGINRSRSKRQSGKVSSVTQIRANSAPASVEDGGVVSQQRSSENVKTATRLF